MTRRRTRTQFLPITEVNNTAKGMDSAQQVIIETSHGGSVLANLKTD